MSAFMLASGNRADSESSASSTILASILGPGVIGTVGTLLGNAGVNISDMDVSRVTGSDTAVMLIAPSAPVPADVLDALRAAPGIVQVTSLTTS